MVQFFEPTIKNVLGVAIRIASVSLMYGKCYDINNPYQEVACPSGVVIAPGANFTFGASSRQGSPTGTEGNLYLVFDASDENIARVYWDSPWGGQSNTLSKSGVKAGYTVTFAGFSYDGSLGMGTITVAKG